MAGFLGIGLFKISSENDERNSDGQILFCFAFPPLRFGRFLRTQVKVGRYEEVGGTY